MTTIKITELTNIGSDLASSTVLPVVNMAGTPTTEKAVLGNIANLILAGAGGNYTSAAIAVLAQTVTNAAQPNITSTGTLTNLTISGNVAVNGNITSNGTAYVGNLSTTGIATITTLSVGTTANLGAVGNVKITGGTAGQVLSTDGAGNLSWASDATTYGNSNVAAYLPTYTGNIGANVVTANLFAGSGANLTNLAGGNVSGAVGLATYATTANSVAGANVSGFVPNANVANTAFAVAAANVSGLGNIAVSNYDGNASNVLHGDGSWSADTTTYSNSNVASYLPTYTGNVGVNTLLFSDNSFQATAFVGTATTAEGLSNVGNATVVVDPLGANVVWTFDTTGNLNLPVSGDLNFNSGGIVQTPMEDFDIRVQDTDDDGWQITQTIDAGDGNIWARTRLQRDQYSVNIQGKQWTFNNNGDFNLGGNVQGDYGVDSSIYVTNTGSNGSLELKTISYIGDTLISNVKVGNPNVTISTGNAAYTWTFDGNGVLSIPGSTFTSTSLNTIKGDNGFRFRPSNNSETAGPELYVTYNDGIQIMPLTFDYYTPGNAAAPLIIAGASTNVAGMAPGTISIHGGHNSTDTTRGNVDITVGTNSWVFDNTGNITVPKNIISTGNTGITIGASYSVNIVADNGDLNHTWTFDGSSGELLFPNGPLIDPTDSIFEVRGAEAINFEANATVNIYTDTSNNGWQWQFGDDGNTSFPGHLNYGGSASPAPSINGFSSASFDMNLTADQVYMSDNAISTVGGSSNLILNTQYGTATDSFIQVPTFQDGGEELIIKNGYTGSLGIRVQTTTGNFTFIGNNFSVPGDITATNIGNIASTNYDGNASNVLYGNGSFAAAPSGSSYGDSNVTTLLSSFGSNTITTTGNVSVGNIIGNGQSLTGIAGSNVTGQVSNSLVAGTVYTAAQPNITSVGTLTSLAVSGNVTAQGVGTNLVRRANTISGSNTVVTLDNLTALVGGTPTRLFIGAASSNMTMAGTSQTMISGGIAVSSWINVPIVTGVGNGFAMSGAISSAGDTVVLNVTDQGAGSGTWRVTGMIANTSANLYSVSIERLA